VTVQRDGVSGGRRRAADVGRSPSESHNVVAAETIPLALLAECTYSEHALFVALWAPRSGRCVGRQRVSAEVAVGAAPWGISTAATMPETGLVTDQHRARAEVVAAWENASAVGLSTAHGYFEPDRPARL
jgi:hypothetical protein